MLFAVVIASEYAPNVDAPPSRAARIFARNPAPLSTQTLAPRADVPPMSRFVTCVGIVAVGGSGGMTSTLAASVTSVEFMM
jgi:hypothetical protein